jgi:hypothetical protein
MAGQYEPLGAPDPELVTALDLRVRELPGHRRRWAWDLYDSRDDSWFESMLEFDSPERANRSGLSRLEELRGEAAQPPKAVSSVPRRVVLSADDPELFAKLRILLATGERVEISPGRRKDLAAMEQPSPDRSTSLRRPRFWPPDSAATA